MSTRGESQQLQIMGVRIRRERVARGLTQEKLAELSDLNIRTLQKIEAGQINILVTTAVRIRVALGSEWREIMP